MAIKQLQKGSTLERKAWMAKVRREKKYLASHPEITAENAFHALIQWGTGREIRTGQKKRGL